MPRISAAGITHLIAWEGEVLNAYRDVAGVWTIGVGLTSASGVVRPTSGMRITAAESRELLQLALARNYEPAVAEAMPAAHQHEFDGGVSFHFNTGAIARASWVTAWKARDPGAVRARLLLWNKAGGRAARGLSLRRESEADLILLGRYGGTGEGAASPVVLRRGMTGEAVTELQQGLAALGLHSGRVDGVFGPATEAAVRALQKAHPNLVVDGVAGPATRAQIARMRGAALKPAGALAAGASAAGGTAFADAASSLPILLGIAVLTLLALALLAWRYRDEVRAWWLIMKEKL